MLEAETIDSLSKLFKVFGDPTRIKILWALNVHDLCVLDICEVLGMTKSAVSHQLGTLKEAKLVKARREGKEVYYSLDDEHVKEIFEQVSYMSLIDVKQILKEKRNEKSL